MELRIGHLLELVPPTGQTRFYQNFFINQSLSYDGHGWPFLPFNFSGALVNRSGDNVEASLALPSNHLSRSWASEVVRQAWVARIRVVYIDQNMQGVSSVLTSYAGMVSNAGWEDTVVVLKLSTVLDAVAGEVPVRVLHEALVGSLPHSNSVLF